MQFDRRRLAGRIVEKFGTRRKFAEAAGIPASSVSCKLNGKTKITADDIYLWISADLLDIPLPEIPEYFFKPEVPLVEHFPNRH